MLFEKTKLPGVYIIQLELLSDMRGAFARSFCRKEFTQHGLHSDFVQCNLSLNHQKGTVRGLHYQMPPHEEVKVVSCRRGGIYDVVVDLRKNAETFGQWLGVELSAENQHSLYIPKGFAHGFQTLTDDTEVFYLMGDYYYPQAATGIYWEDEKLAIKWPLATTMISEQDKKLPRWMP